jgi:predicted nucleic acid-binding protein
MNAPDVFFDTNVLRYVMAADQAKADRVETLIAAGGVISVHVLNEFVSVASRKLAMRLPEIREVLSHSGPSAPSSRCRSKRTTSLST